MFRRQNSKNNQNNGQNGGKNTNKRSGVNNNFISIGNEALKRNKISPNSISNEENNWIFVPPKKKERKYILVHKNTDKKTI